jgi:hypothetical protein
MRLSDRLKRGEKRVNIEDDILDLIAELPDKLNDAGVTTELKFLTLGGVLWACRDEIMKLREENAELRKRKPKR